jgi:hypothetical protein
MPTGTGHFGFQKFCAIDIFWNFHWDSATFCFLILEPNANCIINTNNVTRETSNWNKSKFKCNVSTQFMDT